MNDDVTLGDVYVPDDFEKKHRKIFNKPGSPSLKYLVRTRHLNGLTDCGAVIEPVQRRPMIVEPKFLQWLLSRTSNAA